MAAANQRIRIQVWRQSGADSVGHWDVFEVDASAGASLGTALSSLAGSAVTVDGSSVPPVKYRTRTLNDVEGECAVMVDGRPKVPSAVPLQSLKSLTVLSPMPTFKVIADLAVDLSEPAAKLAEIRAMGGIDADTASSSPCIGCGACLEACPNYTPGGGYIGPAAIAEVYRLNQRTQALGSDAGRRERLSVLLADDGIVNCGNDQTYVDVCPTEADLWPSIAGAKRQATIEWLKRLFRE